MAKKFPYILIKDAKNGFRTQLVGGNGEPLMTSEVLESAKAVEKNLLSALRTTYSEFTNILFSDKALKSSWSSVNIRYTGKSQAIYKMFKIEKIS